MKEINGYRLEALAIRESPNSEHYYPAVRVTETNSRFNAIHIIDGMSYNSRDQFSALLAAQRAP